MNDKAGVGWGGAYVEEVLCAKLVGPEEKESVMIAPCDDSGR
jgi:hypothetical protein